MAIIDPRVFHQAAPKYFVYKQDNRDAPGSSIWQVVELYPSKEFDSAKFYQVLSAPRGLMNVSSAGSSGCAMGMHVEGSIYCCINKRFVEPYQPRMIRIL